MGGPGLETEESMGPPEFHWKASFYGVILDDYHILARATTQEVIDDEIKYASEAGIGYFAYLYYTGALSTALNLHFSSARKEDVKFCMIIEAGRFTPSVVSLLASNYFKKIFYKTVNIEGIDRPLLYLFQCNINTASMIASLLDACEVSGVNAPEAVAILLPTPLPATGPGGFLENPGFESGDYQSGTDNWTAQTCTLQKVWKTFTRSGEQAIKVTGTKCAGHVLA